MVIRMRGKVVSILMLCLFVIGSLVTQNVSATEFPARSMDKYQKVPFIEIDTLYNDYKADKVIIVDVRSDLEFNTIHVDGAVHISLSHGNFEEKLKKLIQNNDGKKIAFYCNGTTCLKSYEAQLQATSANIKNTYAFDLGIPGWAELYPEHTILLGTLMTQSKVQWIPKSDFKKKCLSWNNFLENSKDKNSLIIDARDDVQKGVFNEKEVEALDDAAKAHLKTFDLKNKEMMDSLKKNGHVIEQSFDKLIKNIIKKGKMKDKTLLIFDQVGKQVRWLMYQLEVEGYSDYYFLAKGAQGVIGLQAYRQ